jgi:uncharacterized protein
MSMNPVVHFELPANDRERMKEFYSKTFGWKLNQMGPDMKNYVTVQTGETDENRMLKKPGMINGGFYEKTPDMPPQYPSVVIAVDNINDHMKKVESAGGTIQGKPMEIPGVGTYVPFVDTEGNQLSMLQPSR